MGMDIDFAGRLFKSVFRHDGFGTPLPEISKAAIKGQVSTCPKIFMLFLQG